MNPAVRVQSLRPSPIRALSEGAPPGAIPMGLGEPSWALPLPARLALAEDSESCVYGPNAGLPELREAVADYFDEAMDRVMVVSGSQGALFALFQAWLNPGDAVLVPDPGFLAYPTLARLAGAEAVGYPMSADFTLDSWSFRQVLDRSPNARIAIINHPSNPTGAGVSAQALGEVAEACEARGVLLLSDEVYRELYLHQRSASLRDVSEYGVVLGSVSKAWGAPGLRVGWALGDSRWLAPAGLMHAYMVTAPARPSQRAALALLRESTVVLAEARTELSLRWAAFSGAFLHHFGYSPAPSSGGFYHWLELPQAGKADPMAFCLRLRDEGGVVVVPGFAFGEGGRAHVRLSFGGMPTDIAEGMRRLAPFWRNL